jgi:diguanylate cyclase (GGDEF)-like protein
MAHILAQQTAVLVQRLELEAALRREREELKHAACHDALTGLPNRHLFDDRLNQATAQARRSGHTLAVMFFDLDNFKYVNDTYGHTFGDALIRAVATRLVPQLRESNTLARWGGDEFVLLLPSLESAAEAAGVAQRLLEQLHQPFELLGKEVRTGASVGVALYEGGAEAAEALVRNADIALYRAKATRGSYAFFTEQMNRTLHTKIELGEDLRAALEVGALTLHYQPRVDLAGGRITSLEALARWQHPSKGWVSPAVFIPLAEELGLIRRLGALVLGRACAQAKAWHSAGLGYRVAVNLSVGQLKHPDIVAEVQGALHHCGLEAGLLELEITESTAITKVEEGIKKLQQLRELGIHLSIDDFGTAYSSLAYLKRLPVHSLKIDRSFVGDLGGGATRPADTGVVEAILALGKSLGLSVVAEGVETEGQRQTLLRLGCDQAQGYLFAPPLDAAQVERLLRVEAPLVATL